MPIDYTNLYYQQGLQDYGAAGGLILNSTMTPQVLNTTISPVSTINTGGGSLTLVKNKTSKFGNFLGWMNSTNKSGKNVWQQLATSTQGFNGDVTKYMNSTNKFGLSKANNPFSKGNIKSGASSALLGTAAGMVNTYANKWISDGYKNGVGQGIATVGNTVGGLVGNFNPVLGAAISAGSGIIGGIVQRGIGIKTNEKALKTARSNINRGLMYQGNASSFDNVQEAPIMQNHNTIYKGGWWNKRNANKKNNRLVNHEQYAMNKAGNEMLNNVAVLNHKQTNNMLANYSALGGPIVNMVNGPTDFWLASQQLALQNKAVDNKNKPAQLPNSFTNINAFGGDLQTHGADWSTGLAHINKGKTHEENPKGGVTVGHDNQGVPNMVEEGETIANTKEFGGKVVKDYVFSDRLTVPEYSKEHKDEELPYEMKALKKYEGKTYADASKALEKDSGVDERPNDVIAQNMMAVGGDLLKQSQEKERMKKMLEELMQQIDQLPPEQAQAVLMQMAQMMQQQQQGEQQDVQQDVQQGELQGMEMPQEQQMPQEQVMSQEQPMMEQPMPEEQVPQEEVPQEEPYTGEPYQMSPEEQAIAQEQVPVQQAYGGSINRFDGGGYITRDNFNQLLKLAGTPNNAYMYDRLPNDLMGGITFLQHIFPTINAGTFISYLEPKAVAEFKKTYASLDNSAKQQYRTLFDASNVTKGGALDYATRRWLVDKNGWTEEQAAKETYASQYDNADAIRRYAKRNSKKDDFIRGSGYADRDSFITAVDNEANKTIQEAQYLRDVQKKNSVIPWKELESQNLSLQQVKGLYSSIFGAEQAEKSFKSPAFKDAGTAFNKLKEDVGKAGTQNTPEAMYNAIMNYNNGITGSGLPDSFTKIDDLSKLAYLGGIDNPSNYDIDSLTWGDKKEDQLLTESVKGKDGKNYIRYVPWADPKTGKFNFENKQYTPMEYENTDNYSKPRWNLLQRLYKAKKEQGDKFNFNNFVQEDDFWNNFMNSMQGVYQKRYPGKKYIDDYGNRLSDFTELLGNVSDQQLEQWFGDKGDYNSFLNFIKGRKNPIAGSLFYDAKTAMNHPSWKTTSLKGPGSRDVYYTVDKDGNRTYYNYGPWQNGWDKYIRKVGERRVLNDVGDKEGNITYGQQIEFLQPGNPIDITDWINRRKYIADHKDDGLNGVKKANKYDNFPTMPVWPFGVGLAMQLGSLGYNLANPLDTAYLDELASYSKQSHYKEPYATFDPGYQPYRPINSRALTEPMTGAALAANRQFRNMSAGNYGQAMAHIGNQTNSYLDKVGQSYLQAEAQDRAHQGDVFKNNFMVNQANAEHNANMAKAASDAFSKAGNEAIAGLSAAYKYKQEAEKAKGDALSSSLSGIANLANSYAQQQYQNQLIGWGAYHNAWAPGIHIADNSYHSTAYGGPVRRSVRRSLI